MVPTAQLDRIPRHDAACMVPQPVANGLFEVDATWGTVQPIELAPGVRTIGELELIEHLDNGLPISTPGFRTSTATRRSQAPARSPTSRSSSAAASSTPACRPCSSATAPSARPPPDAIRKLLDAGYPARSILYYRGGMRDWMTLGYPTATGPADPTPGD